MKRSTCSQRRTAEAEDPHNCGKGGIPSLTSIPVGYRLILD
jgi:hypothetical protein